MIDSIRSRLYETRGRRRKLTDEQVIEYRRRFARGETCESIAADSPIVTRVMQRVVTGRTYRQVPMPGPEESQR